MMLVGTNANYILPIPVDGRYVPGILDASSGNWVRIKSITAQRVFFFVGSSEPKYSSTELNFGRLRRRGWCIVLRSLDSRLLSRLRRAVGRFNTELLGV